MRQVTGRSSRSNAASVPIAHVLGVVCLAMLVLVPGCAFHWEPAFREIAETDLFDDVAIADLDDALTFARVQQRGSRRVIAVTEYRGGIVRGVDLSTALGRNVDDPIAVASELGADGVRALVRDAPAAAKVSHPAVDLVIPVDLHGHHIAAGTNFPEHAGEAGVEHGPFLFPKHVEPTGPYDPVSAGNALLDYEVEIAWVTFGPLTRDREPVIGLVLCNDFTDRDTLLRTIDPWNVESGDGFTTGKSFPGYLPIGNLLVVPRDHRRFVPSLELRLYVDGALRQRAMANEMVWDYDEMLRRIWASDRRWDHRGRSVALLDEPGVIAERTLILAGTPHGTVFGGMQNRHYVRGLTSWLFGGWRQPLPDHVIAAYVDDARAAGIYLRPGNQVAIHVDRMGVLRNSVVP